MSGIRHMGLREMYFSLMQDAVLEATENWQKKLAGYKQDDRLRWREFLEDLENTNKRIYTRAEEGIVNPYTASLVSKEAFDDFMTALHPYLSAATESRLTQYVTKRFLAYETEWRMSAKKITPVKKIIEELGVNLTLQELETRHSELIGAARDAMWKSYVANEYDNVRRIGSSVLTGIIELAKATDRIDPFKLLIESISMLSMLISSNSNALPHIATSFMSPQWKTTKFNCRVLFLSLTDRLTPRSDQSLRHLRMDERTLQHTYKQAVLLGHLTVRPMGGTPSGNYSHIVALEGLRFRVARIKESKEASSVFSESRSFWRDIYITELAWNYRHVSQPNQKILIRESHPTLQLENERDEIMSENTHANPLQLATLETAIARSHLHMHPSPKVDDAARWLVRAHKTLEGIDHTLAEVDFYSSLADYMKTTGYTRAEIRAATMAEERVRLSGDKERLVRMRREEESRLTELNSVPVRTNSCDHDYLMNLLVPPGKEKGPPKPRKTKLEPPKPNND